MTKEKFLYGLNACAVTYHNGQKLYEHDELVKCFEDLGIFEQEPKTGRWREDIDNNRRWDRVRFYCSKCGNWQTYGKTHYCPNCGEKMEVEE